jgi:hypothetical protein
VFINEDRSLVVGPFVDDMIIVAKTLEVVDEFKKGFRAIHKLKDLGEIHKCLGLAITRDRTKRILYISQEDFAQKLVDEYLSPRDYTCPTLVSNRENLTKAKSNEPQVDIAQYIKAIGSLMFLQRDIQLDITFIVYRLA